MSKKIVVKFGGSNLKSGKDYHRLVKIIKTYDQPLIVVVSAFYGLTNQIINVLERLQENNLQINDFIASLNQHISDLLNQNIPTMEARHAALKILSHQTDHLNKLLRSIHTIGEIPDFLYDQVLSFGERINAILINEILNSQKICSKLALPERIGLISDGIYGFATVDFERATPRLSKYFCEECIHIVPGFYGVSPHGKITLFGRGGSDYSAASIAKCVGAASVDVWKDVEGFLSADPRMVKNTRRIEKLSYNEAAELSYFGARILHPETVSPLKTDKIPLRIFDVENFDDCLEPATIINGHSQRHPGIIKSITYSDDFGI